MRKFLPHVASALAGSAFALSLSFAWIDPDGSMHRTGVNAQNAVVAMLAATVLILTRLQHQDMRTPGHSQPNAEAPVPIGD